MKRIHVAGGILAALYCAETILSYWLTPVILTLKGHTGPMQFYQNLTGITAPTSLLSEKAFLLTYCGPLLLMTAVVGLTLLYLRNASLSETAPDSFFRWTVVFAVVCAPALPVIAQDFWLSAGWGRMVVEGFNPYHADIPPDIASRWIPDNDLMRMTYGPLWAIISSIVMLLANSTLMAFILFKLVLGAFWVGALALVRRLTSKLDVREQCIALVMAGWAPVGVGQSIAEGHNDVAMMAFVLLWLAVKNPLPLVFGILCKYVAAPLVLIDFLGNRSIKRWLVPAIAGIVIVALFFRGPDFFLNTARMQVWATFLTPRDAVRALGRIAELVVTLLILASAVPTIANWMTNKTEANRVRAVIVMLAVTIFGVIGHIWPWYMVWVLLPAALVPSWWLSRWIMGVCLAAPFSVLYITAGYPPHWMYNLPAVVLYACGFFWLAVSKGEGSSAELGNLTQKFLRRPGTV